jgi:hypothetical protein
MSLMNYHHLMRMTFYCHHSISSPFPHDHLLLGGAAGISRRFKIAATGFPLAANSHSFSDACTQMNIGFCFEHRSPTACLQVGVAILPPLLAPLFGQHSIHEQPALFPGHPAAPAG